MKARQKRGGGEWSGMRWHVHSRVKDTSVTGSPDHGISLPLQALRAWRGVAGGAQPWRAGPDTGDEHVLWSGTAGKARTGDRGSGPGRAR